MTKEEEEGSGTKDDLVKTEEAKENIKGQVRDQDSTSSAVEGADAEEKKAREESGDESDKAVVSAPDKADGGVEDKDGPVPPEKADVDIEEKDSAVASAASEAGEVSEDKDGTPKGKSQTEEKGKTESSMEAVAATEVYPSDKIPLNADEDADMSTANAAGEEKNGQENESDYCVSMPVANDDAKEDKDDEIKIDEKGQGGEVPIDSSAGTKTIDSNFKASSPPSLEEVPGESSESGAKGVCTNDSSSSSQQQVSPSRGPSTSPVPQDKSSTVLNPLPISRPPSASSDAAATDLSNNNEDIVMEEAFGGANDADTAKQKHESLLNTIEVSKPTPMDIDVGQSTPLDVSNEQPHKNVGILDRKRSFEDDESNGGGDASRDGLNDKGVGRVVSSPVSKRQKLENSYSTPTPPQSGVRAVTNDSFHLSPSKGQSHQDSSELPPSDMNDHRPPEVASNQKDEVEADTSTAVRNVSPVNDASDSNEMFEEAGEDPHVVDRVEFTPGPCIASIKMNLFVEGCRVHRGLGPERRFADYWDALARSIANGLRGKDNIPKRSGEDASCNDIEHILKSYLVSKKLRRLHNDLILAIMQHSMATLVAEEEFKHHLPVAWRRRAEQKLGVVPSAADIINGGEEKAAASALQRDLENDRSDALRWKARFRYDSNAWSASGLVGGGIIASSRTLNDGDIPAESRAVAVTKEGRSSLSGTALPGALSIDPIMRLMVQKEGLEVSEDSIWLIIVAVRQHAANMLYNVVKMSEETEGGAEGGAKQTQMQIRSIDLAQALMNKPRLGGGKASSRLGAERCLAAAQQDTPSMSTANLVAMQTDITNAIHVSSVKRQKFALSRTQDVLRAKAFSALPSNQPPSQSGQPPVAVKAPKPKMGFGSKDLAAMRARSSGSSSNSPVPATVATVDRNPNKATGDGALHAHNAKATAEASTRNTQSVHSPPNGTGGSLNSHQWDKTTSIDSGQSIRNEQPEQPQEGYLAKVTAPPPIVPPVAGNHPYQRSNPSQKAAGTISNRNSSLQAVAPAAAALSSATAAAFLVPAPAPAPAPPAMGTTTAAMSISPASTAVTTPAPSVPCVRTPVAVAATAAAAARPGPVIATSPAPAPAHIRIPAPERVLLSETAPAPASVSTFASSPATANPAATETAPTPAHVPAIGGGGNATAAAAGPSVKDATDPPAPSAPAPAPNSPSTSPTVPNPASNAAQAARPQNSSPKVGADVGEEKS